MDNDKNWTEPAKKTSRGSIPDSLKPTNGRYRFAPAIPNQHCPIIGLTTTGHIDIKLTTLVPS
ncbi:MAG: hypothetical protein GY878_13645 [Fuerstiella sp.]|nr:hypothetical protein [Fuerstiella sp.]